MTTELKTATYEVHNKGTRYIAHRATIDDRQLIAVVTGWTGNSGEWIALPIGEDEVAWSYLTEKVPGLARFGGDAEGYVLLFAEMGIRVFNWALGEED
jgi:hypothetical protein